MKKLMKVAVWTMALCLLFAGCNQSSDPANESNDHVHNWQDATCVSPQTCACGETQGEALGHTEVIVPAKEATCSEEGMSEGAKCSTCDEVLRAQEVIPTKEHTPGEEATCTAAQTCTVCNAEVAPAKGHQFENNACTVCNAELTATNYTFALDHLVYSDVGTKNLGGIDWTLDAEFGFKGATDQYGNVFKAPAADNADKVARGQQFGAGSFNAHMDAMTLTSTKLNNVTKIKLRTCGVSGFEGTLTVSVGGTVVGTFELGTDYKGIDYHYEIDVPNLSGEIMLSYSQPDTEKALFIGAIYIEYAQ